MPLGIGRVITLANDLKFVETVDSRTTQDRLLVKVSYHKLGLVEIDCTGLTLRDGRELATYLESKNSVGEVGLNIDLKGMKTRSPQVSISHFLLLVHMAGLGGGTAVPRSAGEFRKDIDGAVKEWMGRFSGKSVFTYDVKLHKADERGHTKLPEGPALNMQSVVVSKRLQQDRIRQ